MKFSLMEKIILSTFLMSLLVTALYTQNLEVEGKAKITVMDTVSDVSVSVVRQSDGTLALRQYNIGDMAQGGIVFYVDESGEHGLAADTVDLSAEIRWYAGTEGNTQAKGDGPFAGEMNTAIIIAAQVALGDDGNIYAARLCAELQKGGYGDWYLPSKQELNLMYTNLYLEGLGGFVAGDYWSSTETGSQGVWVQTFDSGEQYGDGKFLLFRVRAIRAF